MRHLGRMTPGAHINWQLELKKEKDDRKCTSLMSL